MRGKMLVIVSAVAFLLGVTKLSFAQVHTDKATVAEEAVNVGNKICPVSGEKIDEKLRATYEYQGRIYNFCCASCIEEFKKDPEKYIKKIEQELQSASKGQPKHEEHGMEMMHEPESMHQGHHH